eukprot:Phypoly_transcript_05756.p1 GENE.Phypoly_transcript_05756~~Phypoly_transcript_05756.p1  ORF type:complete len:548 (+),score=128.32 Phypoly_transcript_05756:134-1777(+)
MPQSALMQKTTPPKAPPPPPKPPVLPPPKQTEHTISNPFYRPRFKFLKLLLAPDLALVDGLCSVIQATEFDDVSKALVSVFDAHGEAVRLLRWAIHHEIQCTEAASTLFRGVSVATKLVSAYFKLKGKDYLKKILSHLIKEVVVNGCRLEVDPEKIEACDELKANQERLQFHCRVLMDNIFKTVEDCPTALRQVFQAAQQETVARFPDMKLTVVGGFFFLRFVCPSLVAPEGYGLSEQVPDTKARRSLILVSKILQNLANQVEFGSKEEYMKIMNSFITGNMQTMATFVDHLASPPPSPKPPSSSPSRDLSLEQLDLLYTQCAFLKEKIYKKWGVDPTAHGAEHTDPYGVLRAARVERALAMYPHHKKKKVVVDTVQHEVALRAVHKELKQRVERAEKNARAQALATSPSSAFKPPSRPSTPTPALVRSESPAPGARAESPAPGARADSPSPAHANGQDEVAKLIEEVVRLRASLDAERARSRALEERVIAEEKKIEKDAEAKFHREYKAKVQLVKDTLDMLKQFKDQLLARPDLAAEFKSLRLGPS